MFDYFKNCSSNAHQIYCEDSPTKGLYNICQSDYPDFHSRPQLRLKMDECLTCINSNISDNVYVNYINNYKIDRLVSLSQSFQINSERRRVEALKPAANGLYLMCKSLPYNLHLLYRSTFILL